MANAPARPPAPATDEAERAKVAFVFSTASGHLNPSLPVARRLVELGHEVAYLSTMHFKDTILATGAEFYDECDWQIEFYRPNPEKLAPLAVAPGATTDNIFEAVEKTKLTEFGLDPSLPRMVTRYYLGNVFLYRTLPGVYRWLSEIGATAVCYDPLNWVSSAAPLAAQLLHLPFVSILTIAGPGMLEKVKTEMLKKEGVDGNMIDELSDNPINNTYLSMISKEYGIKEESLSTLVFQSTELGRPYAPVNIVTVVEALADPSPDEIAAELEANGITFEYVGALLDKTGARRGVGNIRRGGDGDAVNDAGVIHRFESSLESRLDVETILARGAKHGVVLVSMGTVITSNMMGHGWTKRETTNGGKTEIGVSGKELCQSVYSAAFDALASRDELLVVAVGHQPDAIEGLAVPDGVICRAFVPQVDLLRTGLVKLFVTHGGQNSFSESLAEGVPVVVCPGFGDQPVNAIKAQSLGVGAAVMRPSKPEFTRGTVAEATPEEMAELDATISAFREDVTHAIRETLDNASFKIAAEGIAAEIAKAGGVEAAVSTILREAKSQRV